MTIRELMDHSSHIPQALIIMLAGAWAGIDLETVAAANAAWWLSREGAQAENRYLKQFPGAVMSRWFMWFQKEAWNAKSMREWILPGVVGGFIAAIIGG